MPKHGNGPQLRIGPLAAKLGMNPKTIRYYEEVGPLDSPVRTKAGYRLYHSADHERLQFIVKAKGSTKPDWPEHPRGGRRAVSASVTSYDRRLAQPGDEVLERAVEEGNVVEGVLRQRGRDGTSLFGITSEYDDTRVVIFHRQTAVVLGCADIRERDVATTQQAPGTEVVGGSGVYEHGGAISLPHVTDAV